MKKVPSCCKPTKKEKSGFLSGLIYGIIPHAGCIAFVVFTVLGVTIAAEFLKPLMINSYFFYSMIALSLILATVSAALYLRRLNMLNPQGIKIKWKYLSILYSTTLFISVLMVFVIFPLTANLVQAAPVQEEHAVNQLSLEVNIPCPGHASLISSELYKLDGVRYVKYRFPDYFDVSYDQTTSVQQILSLEIFKVYPATLI